MKIDFLNELYLSLAMIVLCLKGKGEMARPIALQRDDG